MSAFSAGVAALFRDPHLSVAATYRAAGTGDPVSLRAIRSAPDELASFGASRFVSGTLALDIRVADVAALAPGDTVQIDATVYRINGQPRLDSEQLVWSAEAQPDAD